VRSEERDERPVAAAPHAEQTKVVILAGGRGTRLAPYTSVLPKPLMPIGERSILEIVVAQLTQQGFRDIVLSVGYLSHLIRAVFDQNVVANGHGSTRPNVAYVHEDAPLGTAGPLRLVRGLDSTFVVMNGDLLTTLDYRDLIRHHRAGNNVLTIATKERQIKIDYGVLHVDGGSRVVAYDEKPEHVSTVSMGVYVLEPRALEFIPEREVFDFPDLVHALLRAGEPVGAYAYDGLWFDIGRHDDYERAVATWEQRHGDANEEESTENYRA
jgi:NDP-sugar pyrophosphorylase family protein